MAEMVLVPRTDWQAALDAVRTKGGTTAGLTSGQLASAIEAIPTGDGQALADSILSGTFTGKFKSNITEIQESAFAYSGITEADFPNLQKINDYAFKGCESLTLVNFPSVLRVDRAALHTVSALTAIVLPKCEEIRDEGIAWNWGLKTLDLPALKTLSRGSSLIGNTNLTALIIRAPAVAVMENTNALDQTAIAAGTGWIYVPGALVDQYKAAPNWSTYAAQFRAIEDYPEITGG